MQDRIPSAPPLISTLPPNEDRPLWSVMIPTYNCAQYLPETLQSVLLQHIPERDMQIEVVDDGSEDADIEELVLKLGKGRVKYYRQPKNVGSLRNFETCINRAKGKLVHLLHGDDRVKQGYYGAIGKLFRDHPQIGAAFCRFGYISDKGTESYKQPSEMQGEGVLTNSLVRISERNIIQFASITVRREVYERLGSFFGLTYGEDWEMWARIAKYYPIGYTDQNLAEYREHTNSISGNKFLSGQNIKDTLQVIKTIQNYLPTSQKRNVLNKSKRFYASYGLNVANRIWHTTHNKHYVQTQINNSLGLYKMDPLLYFKIAKIYFKILIRRM